MASLSSESNAAPPLVTTNEHSQSTLSRFGISQSQIDRDIIAMTESIRALKTRRNEMSPISWIPPEVLCRIFELVQQAGAGVSWYNRLPNLFGWTKITHVSRRWREIALGNTLLWSNIIITGIWPEWEEAILIRSQKSPISVWVPTGTAELKYRKKLYLVEKVLLELSRITTLSIEGIYPFDLQRILSNWRLPEGIRALMDACRIIPLQYLESLTFSSNITLSVHDWVYTFGHLEHLAWISLGVNSGIHLLSAILSSDNIILPSLRYLLINNLGTNQDTSPMEVMERAFAKRREQNISIRILSLHGFTYLTPEHVQRLEQVVDSLKRDQYIYPEQWSSGTL